MYEIEFTKKAQKQFDKFPYEIQERIISVLERTRLRPGNYFERLVGDKAYKLRVGKYRIIVDLVHEKLIILVLELGHRRNIYK